MRSQPGAPGAAGGTVIRLGMTCADGAARIAAPRPTHRLNVLHPFLRDRALPRQLDACRTVDTSVDDDVRTWRIIPYCEVELAARCSVELQYGSGPSSDDRRNAFVRPSSS